MPENKRKFDYAEISKRIDERYEEFLRERGIIVSQAAAYASIKETLEGQGRNIEYTGIKLSVPSIEELYLRSDR